MVARLTVSCPVRRTFCLVCFVPYMLMTIRQVSPSSQVLLTQVMGAKSGVPSWLKVPMIKVGCTIISCLAPMDFLFMLFSSFRFVCVCLLSLPRSVCMGL